jgi:hypothetical protein
VDCAGPTQNQLPASSPTQQLPQYELTIKARDDGFEMLSSVSAGLLTVKFSNEGSRPHQAMLVRLKEGVTYDQLLVAMKKGLLTGLSMMTPIGGPNTLSPRQNQEVILDLSEGRYLVVSFVTDAANVSDLQRGMFKLLTVSKSISESQPDKPLAESQITVNDEKFDLASSLPAGKRLIQVINAGQQVHELSLLKLKPGQTAQAARNYFNTQSGEPPFEYIGGVAALAPGASNLATFNLSAGMYLAINQLREQPLLEAQFQVGVQS